MKMTRLEWRYLQKIALDHPYYDTNKPPLSDAEARAIMETNNTMTGREFVDSIYAELGMERPEKKRERFAWLRGIGELFTVPPIRKIAILVLAIIMLVVFFTAIPYGRAIAESAIQYIAALFEDGSLAVNFTNRELNTVIAYRDEIFRESELDKRNDAEDYVFLNSPEELTGITGKKPYMLPLQPSKAFYVYDPDIKYLELHVSYESQYGTIITIQIWSSEDIVTSTSTGYREYDADTAIYYSVETNGDVIVGKVLEDSFFGLIAKGSYTLDDVVEILRNN